MPEVRKNQKEWNDEQHLASEAHEDGFTCLTHRLEEVGGGHLETSHPEHGGAKAKRLDTGGDEGGIVGKQSRDGFGEELASQAPQCGDHCANASRHPECAHQAVEASGTIVVAHNRLHTHTHAHHKGNQQSGDGGEDADRRHRSVATVFIHGVVDYGIDDAARRIHDTWCGTDGEDRHQNVFAELVDATFEVNFGVFVEKVSKHKKHRHTHRNIGGDSRTLDAQFQHKDEDRRKNHVEPSTYKHGEHRLSGVARCTHHIVERESDVVENQARQNEKHKIMCVWQRSVARAKQTEHRVHKHAKQSNVDSAKHQSHHNAVAQHLLSLILGLHTQQNRRACAGTSTNQHTESSTHIHHRERDGKTGDSVGTHTLTNKDAVDNVVDRHHHNAHNGRQTVFPQQFAKWCGIKFLKSVIRFFHKKALIS